MHEEPVRTVHARYLLQVHLELCELTADQDQWNEEALAENPPRLIRLKRLKALFAGFDIPWDPEGFAQGSFIQDDESRYHEVIDEFLSEIDEFTGITPLVEDDEHKRWVHDVSHRSWLNDPDALRACFAPRIRSNEPRIN